MIGEGRAAEVRTPQSAGSRPWGFDCISTIMVHVPGQRWNGPPGPTVPSFLDLKATAALDFCPYRPDVERCQPFPSTLQSHGTFPKQLGPSFPNIQHTTPASLPPNPPSPKFPASQHLHLQEALQEEVPSFQGEEDHIHILPSSPSLPSRGPYDRLRDLR